MGNLLPSPVTEQSGERGLGNDLSYGLSCMQGWRENMEDAHCVRVELPGRMSEWSFFSVFDGHSGEFASSFCASHLLQLLLERLEGVFEDGDGPEDGGFAGIHETVNSLALRQSCEKGLVGCFAKSLQVLVESRENERRERAEEAKEAASQLCASVGELREVANRCRTLSDAISQSLREYPLRTEDRGRVHQVHRVMAGIRNSFLELDRVMKEESPAKDKSGTTAACVLASPGHFFFANCGDSRAVLYGEDAFVRFATTDHKPSRPAEVRRIVNAGGHVHNNRVDGQLAMSRALGDYKYKRLSVAGPCGLKVTPEPDVDVLARLATDEFLAVACDGVWDVMSNLDLGHCVSRMMRVTSDIEYIARCIINACLMLGSEDNMSLVLVALPGAPKVSTDEICKDRKINVFLESFLKGMVLKKKKIKEVIEQMKYFKEVKDIFCLFGSWINLYLKYDVVERICSSIWDAQSQPVEPQSATPREPSPPDGDEPSLDTGDLLPSPDTYQRGEQGLCDWMTYGLSCMQGWRERLGDAHYVRMTLPGGMSEWSFFSVFDNKGEFFSSFSSHRLLDQLEGAVEADDAPKDGGFAGIREKVDLFAEWRPCEKGKVECFAKSLPDGGVKEEASQLCESVAEIYEVANRCRKLSGAVAGLFKNYSTLSAEERVRLHQVHRVMARIRRNFLKFDPVMRGSTAAVCVLASPGHFFFVNCGDSRAVLYGKNASVRFTTTDHRPWPPAVERRIVNAEGHVDGQLATSRLKVTPEPDVDVLERLATDEFLAVASDGVWDVMSNEELCHCVRRMMRVTVDMEYIAKCVINACLMMIL